MNEIKRNNEKCSTYRSIYEKMDFFDTIIVVRNVEMKAHKVVLSDNSQFFKN